MLDMIKGLLTPPNPLEMLAQTMDAKFHAFGKVQFENIFSFSAAMCVHGGGNSYVCKETDLHIEYSESDEILSIHKIVDDNPEIIAIFKLYQDMEVGGVWHLDQWQSYPGFSSHFSKACKSFLSQDHIQALVVTEFQKYQADQQSEMKEMGNEILEDDNAPEFLKDLIRRTQSRTEELAREERKKKFTVVET